MSKLSLAIFFALGLTVSRATPAIKSWKVFRNDNGYELKVPDCWRAIIDDPDQEGSVTGSKNVSFDELSICQRPRFHKEVPNGISARALLTFESRAELMADLNSQVKWVTSGVNKNLGLKRFKAGGDDAIMYIEVPSEGNIRWITQIYCSANIRVSTSGPAMDTSSAAYGEYVKRLKAGDLSPPEPEKTILESIR